MARFTVPLLLLGLLAPAASAQNQPVCQQPRYIKPSDLAGIPGAYDLSNGDTLHVSRESRRYYADMDKTGRLEIIPLNESTFAEKGGPVRFAFTRDWPWTDVTITGLDQPRPSAMACNMAVQH